MASPTPVHVRDLDKTYPRGAHAVAGVSFDVAPGEFFGLLGPNGAGKSTTLKILATLLKKTSGAVVVAGHDVDRDPAAIRRSIGFAMQDVGLDDLASGSDFLTLQGILYGLHRNEAKRRAGELLDLVGLTDVASRKVGAYSGGMRRRIDLASALIHRPALLFLDEPTTGLDPQSRLAIWQYLEKLNAGGTTIVLTTQIMEEADRLCRRLAIIDHGKIAAEGSPRTLKSQIGGDTVAVTLDVPPGDTARDGQERGGQGIAARAVALVTQRPYVTAASSHAGRLTIVVRDIRGAVPDLLRLLQDNGIAVRELAVSTPTLDDVFLKVTGHQIRAGDTSGSDADAAMRQSMGLGKR
ncbi:MAG: ATP-binding cassette domain-containing protein [Dehalococcoidia bacterium]|nr:ATP-binding cassette domain-containing protein [Dehalococcoidia bacterium]